MQEIIKVTILGLFFGTFGTTIGGIIGASFKINSNKLLSVILSLASGLMLSIVCFDLIPEAMKITNIFNVLIGVILGIITMITCDILIKRKLNKKGKINTLLKTGIVISIGLALHNFPEGLAIGTGFYSSQILGYALAITICLHDIPEGISMALPMKNGGMKPIKIILYVILSGVATGLGALFGAVAGNISKEIISLCLSYAAGAMLYIVSGELIPESNKLYSGKLAFIGQMTGFLLGMIANKL